MADGQLNERRVDGIYDRAGYWTYRPETTQFGENDVFGLFDVIALEPGHGMRLVQVKSNAARGIKQWCADTLPFQRTPGLSPEFAVVYDGQGGHDPTPWRVRLIAPTGEDSHVTIVDEREAGTSPEGEGVEQFVAIGDDLSGWYPIDRWWQLYVDGDLQPCEVAWVHVYPADQDGEYYATHYAPDGSEWAEIMVTANDVAQTFGGRVNPTDPPEWADE